jgi:NADH dehydrogenase [ubiquinone] 1 alpha subcomplex assembly factor 7
MSGDNGLAAYLRRRILLEGPLSVAAFMTEALGHPRFGYYMTRDPFGTAGDFTTAPEISQMFGELLGLWCVDTWARMGAPATVALVELGPGRGTLMNDALRAAALVPAFRAAVTVHMVETSPALRARQQATLAGQSFARGGPFWHDRLEDVPEDGPVLVIANEFFDALPIRQIQRTATGWAERLVDMDDTAETGTAETGNEGAGGFRFVLEAGIGPGLRLVPESLRNAPPGSVLEVSPASQAVARTLGERLARHGGAALLIDYGYAHGPALGETLQAIRRHAFAPVLESPGEADLTAHVDFAALAAAAREAGAAAHGPLPQGEFLMRLGIVQRADTLRRAGTPQQAAAVDAALDRLIGAEQMGTLFQVLALAAPGLGVPAGFEV